MTFPAQSKQPGWGSGRDRATRLRTAVWIYHARGGWQSL